MNDPKKEIDYLNQLLSEQVDGLIVGTHNQGIKEYRYNNLPIVAIDRIMNEDIPIIESDSYAGGVLATTHLIRAGARKIIHTNGPVELETPASRRRSAYEHTMTEHQLTPITYTIDFNVSYTKKKKRCFTQLLQDHPNVEVIFASNDVDAMLLLQLASEFGKRVPEDLLIIGYDGTMITRTLVPNLTTIIQPIDAMTTAAINVLQKRLNKENTEQEYILPVSLWQGTTGGVVGP